MNDLTPRGMNHRYQKQYNRGLIFQLLATEKSMSRTELARKSGLTKMTLSNIISEFINKGYVQEFTLNDQPAGPFNPAKLTIASTAPKVVGVMIHRHRITAALCDLQLNVLHSRKVDLMDYDEAGLMKITFELTDEMLAHGEDNVVGIGISSIGPVDLSRGYILNPPDFHGLRDIPMVDYFRRRYSLPVYLNHHLNASALAERYYGNGKNYHDFIFLCVDQGLNLGIITGNELYSSNSGYSSEIGRLLVNYSGSHGGGKYLGGIGDYVDFARCNGNPGALAYMVDVLAAAMAGLCDILNPQAIILGGEEGLLSDELIDRFDCNLNERLVIHDYRHIDVLPAFRSQDLEASSSAINVIRQIFHGSLLV